MNYLMPDTTTATELQRHYKQTLNKAKKVKKPLVVLANNQPSAVFMDYESFQKMKNNKSPLQVSDRKDTSFRRFVGSWTEKEAEEFNRVIEENFEKIDEEMWK